MSNLYYKGIVEIQLKIGGKFYTVTSHNEGMNWLKYLFAKYLAGETPTIIPSVMELYKFTEESGGLPVGEGKAFLRNKISASGKTYSDASGYYTEFKSYLSSDNLSTLIEPTDENKYWLYLQTNLDSTTNERHDLARIKVEVSLLSKITPGTTGTITWRMRLLNENEV